jgi:predicted MFS family arabinose efflux permease
MPHSRSSLQGDPQRASRRSTNGFVVLNLFLLLFLGLADNQTIPALLPLLVKSFGISLEQAGLLAVFYSAAAATAAIVTGPLSDHFGRRPFLVAGATLFAVASWSASRTGDLTGLVMARALTGFAAGTISTCSIAMAGDWFPYQVRGRAVGLISVAYFAAPILGVPIAADVAQHFGWRQTFVIFGVFALAVSAASLALPREVRKEASPVSRLHQTLHSCRSFLRRRDTAAGLVIAFFVSGGLYTFIYYIGQWLSVAFHVNTRTIGEVFMLGGLVAVSSAPLGGLLSDRWDKRSISIAGDLVLASSVVLVPYLSWGVWLLVVFGAASLGAAFRQGPLTALMTELVPSTERGTFVALRNVSSQIGIGATVFLGGVLYQWRGYGAVTALCALMTAIVALLLVAYITEPRATR